MATPAVKPIAVPPATAAQTGTSTTINAVNIPDPPFEQHKECINTSDLVTPAAYHSSGPPRELHFINQGSRVDRQEWVKVDLNVSRLNAVHKHLWMSGLPRIPRPLHDHLCIGRTIKVTEQADLHMVSTKDTILLKPLPDYLLNHAFWKEDICPDPDLIKDAKGFLLSYLWLITSKADWAMAISNGLLNDKVGWKQWVEFSRSALSSTYKIDHDTLHDVNPRYIHGELRLDRLNLIYRFCSATRSFSSFIRGYNYGYYNYSSFVERNFAWVLTAIVYITIVLTAMQVGLGTDRLVNDVGFQRAAFGFTVFSIIAPLAIVVSATLILSVLFCFNWRVAKKLQAQANTRYGTVEMHVGVEHERHRLGKSQVNAFKANNLP